MRWPPAYLALSRLAWLAAAGLGTPWVGPAHAGTSGLCERPAEISATAQDRLLRFSAVVRQVLDQRGSGAALIARSGLDLSRFGIRYSHAGIALRSNPRGPWSVRQLYYACDESRPRLFDQGVAGFLNGAEDPAVHYVSIVLLPESESAALETAALDTRLALDLLASDYSANAYAFSTRYQNCNQWVMEMIASAWGQLDDAGSARERAQRWLKARDYVPEPVDVGSHALMLAAHFVPLVHVDDHPTDDLHALKMHVSMPASIEAFVQRRVPGAARVELCVDSQRVIVHRGWQALGPGCQPAPGDEIVALES